MKIKFMPAPKDGVCVSAREGAYYSTIGEKVQVIVVGPMRFSPGEYQVALRDQVTEELYCIEHLGFIQNHTNAYDRRVSMQRGFVSMIFRRARPDDETQVAVPYDCLIQRAIGGYPKGAIVAASSGVWISNVDHNREPIPGI